MVFPANCPLIHHHINCVYNHHQHKIVESLPDLVRDAQLRVGPTSCTCQSNGIPPESSSSSSLPLCSYPSSSGEQVLSPEEVLLRDVGQWLREISNSLDLRRDQSKRKLKRFTKFIVIIISIIGSC